MSNLTCDGIPCMWMRGGTSKGGYFLASDLPQDPVQRDALLLSIMGSPDPRQIDGMGGGNPLTSKVAVIRPSTLPGADVDYLFLQVFVDRALVSDAQNCGNILAGVGPFAIERRLVPARDGETRVRIHMENTNQIAEARVQTPNGKVSYAGAAQIDGVPTPSAPIPIAFQISRDAGCGALFPSGIQRDRVDGIDVTLIDNGMPCVLVRATDLGITGAEAPKDLETNMKLVARLEAMRLQAGPLMTLGDVAQASIPKMTIISEPLAGGTIATRTFIPHRCHTSIGVFAAISVATACLHSGTIAFDLSKTPPGQIKEVAVEHPTGTTTIFCQTRGAEIMRTEVLRSARKLMDGVIFGSSAI